MIMDKKEFANRLSELRIKKDISARDMSLSLGQSAGYINNIENGINFPSMSLFFCICEYLNITPKDFFDTENMNPDKAKILYETAKQIPSEQLEHLIAIAKGLKNSH